MEKEKRRKFLFSREKTNESFLLYYSSKKAICPFVANLLFAKHGTEVRFRFGDLKQQVKSVFNLLAHENKKKLGRILNAEEDSTYPKCRKAKKTS